LILSSSCCQSPSAKSPSAKSPVATSPAATSQISRAGHAKDAAQQLNGSTTTSAVDDTKKVVVQPVIKEPFHNSTARSIQNDRNHPGRVTVDIFDNGHGCPPGLTSKTITKIVIYFHTSGLEATANNGNPICDQIVITDAAFTPIDSPHEVFSEQILNGLNLQLHTHVDGSEGELFTYDRDQQPAGAFMAVAGLLANGKAYYVVNLMGRNHQWNPVSADVEIWWK
jgi:hypothetical protein